MWVVLKKGNITNWHELTLSKVIFVSVRGVYVLLFTLFLPVFFVFHRKDLILLNLISTYVTPTSEQFLKNKGTVDLWKVNFCISKFFIQCNTGSCCVQITDGVNMYLYVCQSVGPCMSRVFLPVSVISNQGTSKTMLSVSNRQ